MINNKTQVLASYPRSGTNYFLKAWKQKTGKDITVFRLPTYIEVLHTLDNIEIISTIKEPLESIISRTMIYYHEDAQRPMYETVQFSINDYEKIYAAIIKSAHHIIDIKNFNNLDSIIDEITNKENRPIDKKEIEDQLDSMKNYSKTFKTNDNYRQISRMVAQHDLSKCNDLYWEAYSLSKYKQ